MLLPRGILGHKLVTHVLFLARVFCILRRECGILIQLEFIFDECLRAELMIYVQVAPVDKLQNLYLRVRIVGLSLRQRATTMVRPSKTST